MRLRTLCWVFIGSRVSTGCKVIDISTICVDMQNIHPKESHAPSLVINGQLATITLSRPASANKLTPSDLQVLRQHIDAINKNSEVLVLVLRAEGKYFCSGFDIAEVIKSSQIKGVSFGEMVDALEACRPITIAVIQGGVYGGATDMALACDFRLGSEAAEMFMPAARLGLHFYQSGLERYVQRLGVDAAKRLFLTSEKLDAKQMLESGFLSSLHSDQKNLDESLNKLTRALVDKAPLALLGMKQSINAIARNVADAKAIDALVQQSIQSSDIREGALAWQEKRAPKFAGK